MGGGKSVQIQDGEKNHFKFNRWKYFYVWPPPLPQRKKIWQNIMLFGGKIWLKGYEIRGKRHIFSLNWLKIYTIAKNTEVEWEKKAEKFSSGEKISPKGRGGGNMNFEFNIQPWNSREIIISEESIKLIWVYLKTNMTITTTITIIIDKIFNKKYTYN